MANKSKKQSLKTDSYRYYPKGVIMTDEEVFKTFQGGELFYKKTVDDNNDVYLFIKTNEMSINPFTALNIAVERLENEIAQKEPGLNIQEIHDMEFAYLPQVDPHAAYKEPYVYSKSEMFTKEINIPLLVASTVQDITGEEKVIIYTKSENNQYIVWGYDDPSCDYLNRTLGDHIMSDARKTPVKNFLKAVELCENEITRIRKKSEEARKSATARENARLVAPVRTIEEVRIYISSHTYQDLLAKLKERIIGQEGIEMIAVGVYNYLECIAGNRQCDNRILITAPSGCGKTETFRAIRDIFEEEIPSLIVSQTDMTSVTEEGFRGLGVEDIVKELLVNDTKGCGIIFLDEFDKKVLPSFDSMGANISRNVQNSILTMVEGRKISKELKKEIDGMPVSKSVIINTSNTLFIALGAFEECRERKRKKAKPLGFVKGTLTLSEDIITRKDMVDIGGSTQLIGRFPVIVNFHKLDEKSIDQIINSLARKAEASFGCKINISKEFRAHLRSIAHSEFGCRLLYSEIFEAASAEYAKHLQKNNTGRKMILNYIPEEDEKEYFNER